MKDDKDLLNKTFAMVKVRDDYKIFIFIQV